MYPCAAYKYCPVQVFTQSYLGIYPSGDTRGNIFLPRTGHTSLEYFRGQTSGGVIFMLTLVLLDTFKGIFLVTIFLRMCSIRRNAHSYLHFPNPQVTKIFHSYELLKSRKKQKLAFLYRKNLLGSLADVGTSTLFF